MDFIFLDKNENRLFTRSDAVQANHREDEYIFTATFPFDGEKKIERGQYIGFKDIDGNFQLFEIRQAEESNPALEVQLEAHHAGIAELMNEVITNVTSQEKSAAGAVQDVLEHTRWNVGSAVSTEGLSIHHNYTTVWDALKAIKEKWGVTLQFIWLIGEKGISVREIHTKYREGADRGKRLLIGKEVTDLTVSYDDRGLLTALYGRGKGVEVDSTETGNATYTERLTIAGVEWTSPTDPVDKPLGQEYIEDTAATAKYGRCGRPRVGVMTFDNIEDENELINATWDYLQKVNTPKVTYSASIIDLEPIWGYTHEAVRLGDDVAVIDDTLGVEIKAEIIALDRDYIQPENTALTIGNYREDITDMQAQIATDLNTAAVAARICSDVAVNSPSLREGYLDTKVTTILSSGTNTNRYIDPETGGDIYENEDRDRAVKFTGSGILIGKKIADEWDWRTAIDGNGIVADQIASGTLNSELIFAGELEAARGTITFLEAGDDSVAHLDIGSDDTSHEPFIKVIADDGQTVNLAITKSGVNFGDFGNLQKYQIDDRIGIGVYI